MTPTKWFVCPQPNLAAETRLFIFPYAGGNPAAFIKWTAGNIETQIAHYPGRGSRFNESVIRRLDVLVENIVREIQPLLDKPFALFGHSMGGLIAFELARKLRQQNLPQPKCLFVSACGAPHIPDPNPPIHGLLDNKLFDVLKGINGIPSEILNQMEAMKIHLPIARSDFEALESYKYEDGEPLTCPILAFGGLDDLRVSRERIEAWASLTTAAFTAHYFPGDHFFLNANTDVVLETIRAKV